ncbi:eukaryotic elongation factor 2 kinase-related [Anaeramoeba flamelloides]|uniref:Eukaryotic elongation factor 2 kinase-related n=1 Tax=Anaeramoeba flamelloides TaxID=1746091 RepID=A0AAV7Z5M0_9EUKA|nr:eukaryotic elongation factor 2 kinase-related [Anaeramoeba flamelloides]
MSHHKKKNYKGKSHSKRTKKTGTKPTKSKITESSDDISPSKQSCFSGIESSSCDSERQKESKRKKKRKREKATKIKKKSRKDLFQRKKKRINKTKNIKKKKRKKKEVKKKGKGYKNKKKKKLQRRILNKKKKDRKKKKLNKNKEKKKKKKKKEKIQKEKKLDKNISQSKEICGSTQITKYKTKELPNNRGFKIIIEDKKGWSELTNEFTKTLEFPPIDKKALEKKKTDLKVTKNFHFQILILVEIGGNVKENEKLKLIVDELQKNFLDQKYGRVTTEISIIGYKSEENEKDNGNKEKNLKKNKNLTKDKEKEKETGNERKKKRKRKRKKQDEEEKFEKISDTISLIKFTNSNLRKILKENKHHFSSNKSYQESTNLNVIEALKIASQQKWVSYSTKKVLHYFLSSGFSFEQKIANFVNKLNSETETKKDKEKEKEIEKENHTKEEQNTEISKEEKELDMIKVFFNQNKLEYFIISNKPNFDKKPFKNYVSWVKDQLPNTASKFTLYKYNKPNFCKVVKDITNLFKRQVFFHIHCSKNTVKNNTWLNTQEIEIKYIDFANTNFDEVKKKTQNIGLKTITKKLQYTEYPFSSGEQRDTFHMLDNEGNHLVLKIPKKGIYKQLEEKVNKKRSLLDLTFEAVLSELTTCYISMFLALRFLERSPYKSIDVLEGFICKITHPSEKTLIWAYAEPFLHGNFQKYTTNTFFYLKNAHIRTTLESFIHFSSDITDGKLIISDLQGVEMNLTDLTISTKGYQGNGVNMGDMSFENFFKNHECSYACTKIRLPINKRYVEPLTSNERSSSSRIKTVRYHDYKLICRRLWCGEVYTCKPSECRGITLKLCNNCKEKYNAFFKLSKN